MIFVTQSWIRVAIRRVLDEDIAKLRELEASGYIASRAVSASDVLSLQFYASDPGYGGR